MHGESLEKPLGFGIRRLLKAKLKLLWNLFSEILQVNYYKDFLREIVDPKPKITGEAAQILRDVASKIGVNILKARIENVFDTKYSKEVDMILSSNQ